MFTCNINHAFLLSLCLLLQSQAEAHYKGNRHARRVKGIETSKSRPQEGEKPQPLPPTSSPSPPGAPATASDSEPSKAGEKTEKCYEVYKQKTNILIHAGCLEAYGFSKKWKRKYARITKASNHSGFAFYCSSCEYLGSVCGRIWLQHISWPTTQPCKLHTSVMTVLLIMWGKWKVNSYG